MFDVAIYCCQLVEVVIALYEGLASSSQNLGSVGLVRTLRVLRVLRIARALRFLEELRTIVFSIMGSLQQTFWTLVLFFIIIYVVGIFLTMAMLNQRMHDGITEDHYDMLHLRFGSLSRSGLTLLASLIGGIDWDEVAQPLLREISPTMGALFVLYIAFMVLAVMNVVTGVFVQSVRERASKERDRNAVFRIRQIFQRLDEDGTGMLSWETLSESFKDEAVLNTFSTLGVEREDLRVLFKLLDFDFSGVINAEEFFQGCLRLRGPAKALDVVLILQEMRGIRGQPVEMLERSAAGA